MTRGVGTSRGRSRRGARVLGGTIALGIGLAGAPVVAGADALDAGASPITVPSELQAAKSAFEQHARSWMADLEKNEAENRRKAPVYGVAQEAVIRFDGYGDEYETQVKATGHATAPFVGILRYKEHLYTCLRDDLTRCTVTRSVPVSEIFSFKNGRWTY